MQEDTLSDTMTVRECIEFSAYLKLPTNLPTKEKNQRIEEVMKDLKIDHLSDCKIGGFFNRGISGGEKRRVSVAMVKYINRIIS
jgi:ABC-type multidrug transport system ATPase subunit